MPDLSTFAPYSTQEESDSLPSAIPLERHLLSALLTTPELFEALPDEFTTDALLGPSHSVIFETARDAADQPGAKVILPIVQQHMPDLAGPRGYLNQLIREPGGVSPADIREYAGAIMDAWQRRQIIAAAQQAIQDATSSRRLPISTILTRANAEIDNIALNLRAGKQAVSMDEAIERAIANGERSFECGGMMGISSGFACINRRTGGLEPAKLYLLAGRPGMAKTALATQIGMRIARQRRKDAAEDDPQPYCRVLDISLEMAADEKGERALSLASRVKLEAIRSGDFRMPGNEAMASAIVRGQQTLRGLPFHIEDDSSLSVGAIRNRLRHFIRRHGGCEAMIIDHLGYIQGDGTLLRSGGTVLALSVITKGLKAIAKDFRIPVILIAQLNREVDKREDKRPDLPDVRGSGTIEEDCNVVMFLYRQAYYDRPPARKDESDYQYESKLREWEAKHALIANKGEIIFAKCRHGNTGIDTLIFDKEYARWSEEGDRHSSRNQV